MRLLWLPEVLRRAGLTVHEYPGWRDRGSDSYGPVRGITCHGTAGSRTSTDAGELRTIAITGSSSAPAPIAQLYLSRSGEWTVVASGTCYHNLIGWGGPNRGYGNDSLLGIEAQHNAAEPWTDTQYRSYVRGVAALVAHWAPGYKVTVDRVAGHYEHQPKDKSDPWFDMVKFRRDVADLRSRGTTPMGEDIMFVKIKGQDPVYVPRGDGYVHMTSQPAWDAAKTAGHKLIEVPDKGALEALLGKPYSGQTVTLSTQDRAQIVTDVLAGMPKPPTAQQIADLLAARLAA